jgi:hypothetical protein
MGRNIAARRRGAGATRKMATAVLTAAVAVLLTAAPAALAGTWTINGSFSNDTGSNANTCPPGSNLVGCVNFPYWYWVDGAWEADHQQGQPPPGFVGVGQQPQTYEMFAPYYDEGADLYGNATTPDGSQFLTVAQDDIAEGSDSGRYAGCSEPSAQSPTYVCTPTWSGDDENMNVAYDFAPSTQPQTISAGQWCGATLGGGGPSSIDCATDAQGRISPIPLDDTGMETAIEFETLTPSVPVTISVAGWPNVCSLGGSDGTTCTTQPLYTFGPPPNVNMALNGGQGSPVGARIEVVSVGVGGIAIAPPQQNPGSNDVGPLRAGQTVSGGQSASVGPYTVTMSPSGELGESANVGNDDYRVFSSGTSVPGSTLVARADGTVAVRSPKGGTLWSSDALASSSYPSKGNLVLFSKRHRQLWSSSGPLAGPARRRGRRAVTLKAGDGIPAGGQLTARSARLTMQADGDLVLSRRGKVRWRSRTQGRPGAYLQVRGNGDAVLYSLDHRAVWSTRTAGHRGARLTLRADGALGVTTAAGKTIWSAHR